MGMAGQEDDNTSTGVRQRAAKVSKAEIYIDRARECTFLLLKSLPQSAPFPLPFLVDQLALSRFLFMSPRGESGPSVPLSPQPGTVNLNLT